jgi:hypothetical protein
VNESLLATAALLHGGRSGHSDLRLRTTCWCNPEDSAYGSRWPIKRSAGRMCATGEKTFVDEQSARGASRVPLSSGTPWVNEVVDRKAFYGVVDPKGG